MVVYRICHTRYADDISGTGASIHGGRWNDFDFKALYAAEHISLAALELIVQAPREALLAKYTLLELELPSNLWLTDMPVTKLREGWQHDLFYTRSLGTYFLRSESLLLKVPSVIIPQEHNYVINPYAATFTKVKLKSKQAFDWDMRLVK
jgi:RES domain-containing protein